MTTTNDIPQKDDALRRAMQHRKALRPATTLPEGLEDRVMDRITRHVRKARLVRLWAIRIASAAAIAIVFFFAETMMQEKDVEKPKAVAKAEVRQTIRTDTKAEERPVHTAELVQATQHHSSPAPRRQHKQPDMLQEPTLDVAEETTLAQTQQDVCIDCEMAAMTSDLTAMINEFENQ